MPRQGVELFDPGRFRAARERAGLSQGALARRIGVRPGAINAWENGRHQPTAARLAAAADALGVTIPALTRPAPDLTLRALRQYAGLTGQVAGQRIHRASSWLFAVERGEQPLSDDLRRQLAELYGTSPRVVQEAYDRTLAELDQRAADSGR